jgi:capsular polysaccharide biosynthesis protein
MQAEIPVEVTELDDWDVEEELDTGLTTFAAGGQVISPSLTRHRDVIVTGRDWLPMKNGCVALLVHSPPLYFSKVHLRQALRRSEGLVRLATGSVRRLSGTSILIGGVNHLYHWLIDYLPRLLLAKRVMGKLPRILINSPGPIQVESLRRIGVHEWEVIGDEESVLCEDLWIPSLLARMSVPHPAVVKMLREALRPTQLLPRRDLYLSRRDATSRHLLNEDELLRSLPGFEMHLTAHLSLQDQINLFASVDRLVGVHGNGLTNQLFCEQGTQVFEIAIEEHRVTSMLFLAAITGLKHHFVRAQVATLGEDGRELLGHWRVDIDSLRAAMAT